MTTKLPDWLIAECERRDLSWAKASRGAGLASNTISQIVNGQRPGLEVCKGLAHFFGASPERILRMAGHLPPAQETVYDQIPYHTQFVDRLQRLSRDRQDHYMRMALMMLDFGEDADAPSEVLSGTPPPVADDDQGATADN